MIKVIIKDKKIKENLMQRYNFFCKRGKRRKDLQESKLI